MSQPPEFYQQTRERYPDLFASYEALGEAAKNAGPLDAKTAALTKLVLSISSGLEGASHAHARIVSKIFARSAILSSRAQPSIRPIVVIVANRLQHICASSSESYENIYHCAAIMCSRRGS